MSFIAREDILYNELIIPNFPCHVNGVPPSQMRRCGDAAYKDVEWEIHRFLGDEVAC